MGKYGQVAVKAEQYVQKGKGPRIAWKTASCAIFEPGTKGCPKNAFLGLHGGHGKNATYAQRALKYLKTHPNINISNNELWKIATDGANIQQNSQMDVVLSLYKEGLI
jgi:hypothetical protein